MDLIEMDSIGRDLTKPVTISEALMRLDMTPKDTEKTALVTKAIIVMDLIVQVIAVKAIKKME